MCSFSAPALLTPAAFQRGQSLSGTKSVPRGCTEGTVLGGKVQGKLFPDPKQEGTSSEDSSFGTQGWGQEHPREMLPTLGLGTGA